MLSGLARGRTAGGPFPVAIPLYLCVTWLLYFLTSAEARRGEFAYSIPELADDPLEAVRTMFIAPFLNHSTDQILYTTVLLLTFGLWVERRQRGAETALLFFAASIGAALFAGAALHALYPGLVDGGIWQEAWERTYSGGSAGAVGLVGAAAAGMRKPAILLGLFVAWEIGIWAGHLRNYTPFFHLSALAIGFALATWLQRPSRTASGQ